MKWPWSKKNTKTTEVSAHLDHHHHHDHGPADSCTGEPNVYRSPVKAREWAPQEFGVRIFVAGNLNQSRKASSAVMKVQQELTEQFKKDFPDTKLVMCVDTFLDGCRHSTGWTDNPSDIGSISTRWHCYQSETRFNEAFDAMANGTQRDADVVLIVGDRFDDKLQETVAAARNLLEEKKTRIFAIADQSAKPAVHQAYEQIAQQAGGIFMPINLGLNPEREYATLVREIAQHTLHQTTGRAKVALPAPQDETTQKLRLALQKLDK